MSCLEFVEGEDSIGLPCHPNIRMTQEVGKGGQIAAVLQMLPRKCVTKAMGIDRTINTGFSPQTSWYFTHTLRVQGIAIWGTVLYRWVLTPIDRPFLRPDTGRLSCEVRED
jgi:hypothetical protein